MTNVGPILSSIGTLIVAVGILVVLIQSGGLIDALSVALGGRRKDETETKEN